MDENKVPSLQPSPAVEPVKPALMKDPHAGIDLPLERRPGYNRQRGIKPWPNSRWPIDRQQSDYPVLTHGRSNKSQPPVFGTDAPPKGLSGGLRRLAYLYPDHMARHWMMLLAADRVDNLEHRMKKLLPVALPLVLVGWAARKMLADRPGGGMRLAY